MVETASAYYRYCVRECTSRDHWTNLAPSRLPDYIDYTATRHCLINGKTALVGIAMFTEPKSRDEARAILETAFVQSVCEQEHLDLMNELWPKD